MKPISIFLFLLAVTLSAEEIPSFPFIFVRGRAEIEVPPNFSEISFDVLSKGSDYKVGNERLREFTGRLLQFLQKSEISENDIRSFEVDIQREENYETGKLKYYKFTRDFTVRFDKLDHYGDFIDQLLDLGFIENLDVDFDHTDSEILKEKTIEDATADAVERAKKLASSLGTAIQNVHAISEVNFDRVMDNLKPRGEYYNSTMYSLRAGAGSSYFIPENITIDASIYVLFRLKE